MFEQGIGKVVMQFFVLIDQFVGKCQFGQFIFFFYLKDGGKRFREENIFNCCKGYELFFKRKFFLIDLVYGLFGFFFDIGDGFDCCE